MPTAYGVSSPGPDQYRAPDRASPVSIDYYDWSIHTPIREGETYSLSGGITAYERKEKPGAPTVDSFIYEIDVAGEDGELAAQVAFRWHYWRNES